MGKSQLDKSTETSSLSLDLDPEMRSVEVLVLCSTGYMCSAAEGMKITTAIVEVIRLFVLHMARHR